MHRVQQVRGAVVGGGEGNVTALVPLPAEGDPHARFLTAYLDGLQTQPTN